MSKTTTTTTKSQGFSGKKGGPGAGMTKRLTAGQQEALADIRRAKKAQKRGGKAVATATPTPAPATTPAQRREFVMGEARVRLPLEELQARLAKEAEKRAAAERILFLLAEKVKQDAAKKEELRRRRSFQGQMDELGVKRYS